MGCDELVFAGQYTTINEPGKGEFNYHVEHFTCATCETTLGGKEYFRDKVNDEPHCQPCYQREYAAKCPGCGLPVGLGVPGGFFEGLGKNKDETWHDHCYKCSNCGNAYAGMEIAPDDGKLYCPNCMHTRGEPDPMVKEAEELAKAAKEAEDKRAAEEAAAAKAAADKAAADKAAADKAAADKAAADKAAADKAAADKKAHEAIKAAAKDAHRQSMQKPDALPPSDDAPGCQCVLA